LFRRVFFTRTGIHPRIDSEVRGLASLDIVWDLDQRPGSRNSKQFAAYLCVPDCLQRVCSQASLVSPQEITRGRDASGDASAFRRAHHAATDARSDGRIPKTGLLHTERAAAATLRPGSNQIRQYSPWIPKFAPKVATRHANIGIGTLSFSSEACPRPGPRLTESERGSSYPPPSNPPHRNDPSRTRTKPWARAWPSSR
jgi:hypothetical protein